MRNCFYILLIMVFLVGCSDFYPLYFENSPVVVKLQPPRDSVPDVLDTLTRHTLRDTVVIWQANFLQPHKMFVEFSLLEGNLANDSASLYGIISAQHYLEFGLRNLENGLFEGNIVHETRRGSTVNEYIIMRPLSGFNYVLEVNSVDFQRAGSVALRLYVGYDSQDTVGFNIARLNRLYSTFEISSSDSVVMEPGSSYFSHFYTQPGDSVFGYLLYSDTLISSWIVNEEEFDRWVAGFKELPPVNYYYFNKIHGDTLSLAFNSEERLYFIVSNDSPEFDIVISDHLILKRSFY